MQTKVVDLNAFKNAQVTRSQADKYRERLVTLDKADLLCELLAFHDIMKSNSDLDLATTVRGLELMKVIQDRSLTPALKGLAEQYHQKLQDQYSNLLAGKNTQ